MSAAINFTGMTPEQIAEVIAQRRAEYQEVVKVAKKAGVKVPRGAGSADDGPKSLVPVLAAAVRRTAAAHLRTRKAQQEEQEIQAIEQRVIASYLAEKDIKALPREVRVELDTIRKDIGDVELGPWVDPQVTKREKEAAKKANAAAAATAPATTTEGEQAPADQPVAEEAAAAG